MAGETWRKSWKTIRWLMQIMIPVTIVVNLLKYVGAIDLIAQWLNPLMQLAGLPGHSAIAFLTGAFVSTYGGIAALLAMDFTLREATIIAAMIGICHALPLESAVAKKTGSSLLRISFLRFGMAIVAAFFLNAIMPDLPDHFGKTEATTDEAFSAFALHCLWALAKICLMVMAIIYALMMLQRAINHYGIMDRLTKPLRPLMRLFGLPQNATYMWLVGNVLGVSYGCAVMLEFEEQGQISRDEANEVNYHLAMNHSMVEDTLVFASFGMPALWILFTRVFFAIIVVWVRKLLLKTRMVRRFSLNLQQGTKTRHHII